MITVRSTRRAMRCFVYDQWLNVAEYSVNETGDRIVRLAVGETTIPSGCIISVPASCDFECAPDPQIRED